MSLKAVLNAILTLLVIIVLAAVSSLLLLTSYLHQMTSHLQNAVEGVRLAERLGVELLTYYRQGDLQLHPLSDVRTVPLQHIEARLQAVLDEMEPLAVTAEEQELMQEIRQKVNAYLAAYQWADGASPEQVAKKVGPLLDEALSSLEKLVAFNVREAHNVQAQANRWDQIANIGGSSVAVLLLMGMATILLWMRRAVLRPVLQVSQAMRRFGAGYKSIRAPETGPAELREMARTFNEMASSLSRQQDDQLAFLAGVAHDLRNPLSALKMSTELADSSRSNGSPERIQKMLVLVRRQVARLDRMVGDLLDSTRIEAGRLELQLEERDARELAHVVVELYQAAGPSHELSLSVPESPVLLRCDGARIEQVLNNLVSNALKYSPEGRRVEVTVQQRGEEALLSVSDQGIGISAEEQRYLFTPFRRSPGARQRASGAGLGLSVARRIVEAHGGLIEVDSQPGQGSVFRIRLPLSCATQRLPLTPEPPPSWTPHGEVH
jgi:two-component system sensor histidine kinase MtrB